MKNYLKENKNRIIILFGAFIFQSLIYFITKLFQNNPVYLNNAIDDVDADEEVIKHLIDTLAKYIEK